MRLPTNSLRSIHKNKYNARRNRPPPPKKMSSLQRLSVLEGGVRNSNKPQPPALQFIKNRIIKTTWWSVIIFLFTLVLLFGPPLKFLLFTKAADIFFDSLFLICIITLIIDIILRCLVTPKYFQWSFPIKSKENAQNSILSSNVTFHRKKKFQIGSFMFWCDLISTISLLSEITFIFTQLHSTLRIEFDVVNGYEHTSILGRQYWIYFLIISRVTRIVSKKTLHIA